MDSSLGCGVGLNIPERTKLEMAKTKPRRSSRSFGAKSTEPRLICICCGTKKAFTSAPVKTFYVWYVHKVSLPLQRKLKQNKKQNSVGDGLRALPNVSQSMAEALKELQNESFTGNLDTSVDVESKEEDGDAVTELHRLSAKVSEIDFDVSIVPYNAYFVDSSHQVRKNKTFQGLNFSLASSLSSYYHFRDPVKMNRKSVLEKRALIPSTQFLDPLSEDSPKGIWRLQFSADKSTVSIRSLLWPGYFFSHKINQSKYSGAYFGDGKKNGSLPF